MNASAPGVADLAADADRDEAVDDAARLVARARRVLANGELAMSARPLLFGESGVYPQFIAETNGCRFVDTTGRVYVDWVVGWGSALLGYRRAEIEEAVRKQLAAAPTLSMPHALEVEVAERIVERFFPAAGDRPERQRRLFEELERAASG